MTFPGERTALYRFYSQDDELLYVGISSELRQRYRHHAKSKPWWSQVAVRDAEWFPTRDEAILAERDAIRREKPRYNIQHAHRTKAEEKSLERVLKGKVAQKAWAISRYAGLSREEEKRRQQMYKLASGLDFAELRRDPTIRTSEDDILRARNMPMPQDARRLLDEVDSFLQNHGGGPQPR